MKNFYNYLTQPISTEDLEIWTSVNNIIPEKLNLFSDFINTLYIVVAETYLGESEDNIETKIELTDEDRKNHFKWCWSKTIEIFSKENFFFELTGEHYDYFYTFFEDVFYKQTEKKFRESLDLFLHDLFNFNKPHTKSDLDIISTIYKLLEVHTKKNIKKDLQS